MDRLSPKACFTLYKVENFNQKGDTERIWEKELERTVKRTAGQDTGNAWRGGNDVCDVVFFCRRGKTTASEEAEALSGSCIDILNKVYETADLDASMRDAMQDYEMTTIDADMEEYVLGTDEITYTDSAYSAPMMTSVAYQCVVLRVPDGPMCRRQNRRFWTMPILQNGLRGGGECCGGEYRGCDFICYGLRRGRVCNKRCISGIGRMRWMQLRNNKLLM